MNQDNLIDLQTRAGLLALAVQNYEDVDKQIEKSDLPVKDNFKKLALAEKAMFKAKDTYFKTLAEYGKRNP